MGRFIVFFRRRATFRNAFIFLGLFLVNAVVLDALDRPLLALANGEPKLDLRFGYDMATVEMLFKAYGPEGRVIYLWNLLADTPFPVLGGAGLILLALATVKNPAWQKILVLAPAIFALTDLVENAFLAVLTVRFPELSETLVAITSVVTQVKRAAFYTSALELAALLILAGIH